MSRSILCTEISGPLTSFRVLANDSDKRGLRLWQMAVKLLSPCTNFTSGPNNRIVDLSTDQVKITYHVITL
jgi:hypothetical protein